MKTIAMKKTFRTALSCLLAGALALSLCLPLATQERVVPENPISIEDIREIETVLAGEGAGDRVGEHGQPVGGTSADSQGSQLNGETGEQGGQQTDEPTTEPPEDQPDDQPDDQPEPPTNPVTPDEPQTLPDDETLPEEPNGGQEPENAGDPEGVQPGQEGEGGILTPGNTGSEGEQISDLDLGLVLTWYKYGSEKKTVVCGPNSAVKRTILNTQLREGQLRYSLDFTGADAELAEITKVTFGVQNAKGNTVNAFGKMDLEIPEGRSYRNYCFGVTAVVELLDPSGVPVMQEMTFTIVLRYENGMDLELDMRWNTLDGSAHVTCAADKEAWRLIKSTQLEDGMLSYGFELQGDSAGDAELVSVVYESSSDSGDLRVKGGSLPLRTAEGEDTETYIITAEVELYVEDEEEGETVKTVYFTFILEYENQLDLVLDFTWYKNGIAPQTLSCEPNEKVTGAVKNNQVTGGQLLYDLKLVGTSAAQAKILSANWKSSMSSGALSPDSGTLALSVPEGRASEKYTLTVRAQVTVGGMLQTVEFTVVLTYASDLSLEMQYTLQEEGGAQTYTITCENRKSKQAEPVYDSQLTSNMLPYTMKLVGGDAEGAVITSVQLYQAGSRRTEQLTDAGQAEMMLEGGKQGENTFTITAADSGGNTYTFTINIPYKHEGNYPVLIETNLQDGETVTNETEVMLLVEAWSEDGAGNLLSRIRASGTNSKLQVWLDGELCTAKGMSGNKQQYVLYPQNPVEGDQNEHLLQIYAEDEYGNNQTLELTLMGERSQSGQVIGRAEIYIDMTVLGLGMEGPIYYDVLSDEPVSYVVAKAVWGETFEEPFGSAKDTFGWSGGTYDGLMDRGFYLESLSDGSAMANRADTLSGTAWRAFGTTDEEVLAAIDNLFGEGSGLAVLWRCIYRNEIPLSTIRDPYAISEQDFTLGSGWVYSVGNNYPGASMSEYYLKDGDKLTLRYTLAYGWDVGNGGDAYGLTAGYCVKAANGRFRIDHQWEEQEDGSKLCVCCGTVAGCEHKAAAYQDLEDGTHAMYCADCEQVVSFPEEHRLTCMPDETGETHSSICEDCGMAVSEEHHWKELDNTATCMEGGILTLRCADCGLEKEEPSEARGHQTDNTWHFDAHLHYGRCTVCQSEIDDSRGEHEYVQDRYGDWICEICGAMHGWDICDFAELEALESLCDCQMMTYVCPDCEYQFEVEGTFPEYHTFENGYCTTCGEPDPTFIPDAGHQHEWADELSWNEQYHWYECIADGCEITNNREKDGYEAHAYDDEADAVCDSCGYERTLEPLHTHQWSDEWTFDDERHWHECKEPGCDITKNRDKDGYDEHQYDDDTDVICDECGFERVIEEPETEPEPEVQPETGE